MKWKFPKYPDNWDEIREKVFERDGYTCKQCGALGREKGGDAILYCHHEERKDDYDSLLTLCEECHIKEHPWLLNNPKVRIRHLERVRQEKLARVIKNIIG